MFLTPAAAANTCIIYTEYSAEILEIDHVDLATDLIGTRKQQDYAVRVGEGTIEDSEFATVCFAKASRTDSATLSSLRIRAPA